MLVFVGREAVFGGGASHAKIRVGRAIEVVALVLEHDLLRENGEPMGKAPRDEHHPMVLPRQLLRMHSRKWRALQVHGDIQHGRSPRGPAACAAPLLEMQPA